MGRVSTTGGALPRKCHIYWLRDDQPLSDAKFSHSVLLDYNNTSRGFLTQDVYIDDIPHDPDSEYIDFFAIPEMNDGTVVSLRWRSIGAETALAEDITDSDTEFTVDAADFTGQFGTDPLKNVVRIGDEYMKITAVTPGATDTWTVRRGLYGTTAAAHSTDDAVYLQDPGCGYHSLQLVGPTTALDPPTLTAEALKGGVRLTITPPTDDNNVLQGYKIYRKANGTFTSAEKDSYYYDQIFAGPSAIIYNDKHDENDVSAVAYYYMADSLTRAGIESETTSPLVNSTPSYYTPGPGLTGYVTDVEFTPTSNNSLSHTGGTVTWAGTITQTINSGSKTGLDVNETYWIYATRFSTSLTATKTVTDAFGDHKALLAIVQTTDDTNEDCLIESPWGLGIVVSRLSALVANLGYVTAGVLICSGDTGSERIYIDADELIDGKVEIGANAADGTKTVQILADGSGFLGTGDSQITWGTDGAVVVPGASITDGEIVADKLTRQAKRFFTTIVFSATDYNTVEWTTGEIDVEGESQITSINAGNTGDMASTTYVYYNNTTTLQVTTDYTDITADESYLLMCVCWPADDTGSEAAYIPAVGVLGITDVNIAANSISADKVQANAITAGKIEAAAIDGMTITGAIVRTAAAGSRVALIGGDEPSSGIFVYNDADVIVGRVDANDGSGWFGDPAVGNFSWDGDGSCVASAITVNSGTFLHALFRTADGTDGRVEIDAVSGIVTYDGSNNKKVQLPVTGTAAGDIYLVSGSGEVYFGETAKFETSDGAYSGLWIVSQNDNQAQLSLGQLGLAWETILVNALDVVNIICGSDSTADNASVELAYSPNTITLDTNGSLFKISEDAVSCTVSDNSTWLDVQLDQVYIASDDNGDYGLVSLNNNNARFGFNDDGVWEGHVCASANSVNLKTNNTTNIVTASAVSFNPGADGTITCGSAALRWADVKSVLINGADICFENGWRFREYGMPDEDVGKPEGYVKEMYPDGIQLMNPSGQIQAVFHNDGLFVRSGVIKDLSELGIA